MKAAVFFGLEPSLNCRVLVRAVIIQNEVHLLVDRQFLFQSLQELDEFAMRRGEIPPTLRAILSLLVPGERLH